MRRTVSRRRLRGRETEAASRQRDRRENNNERIITTSLVGSKRRRTEIAAERLPGGSCLGYLFKRFAQVRQGKSSIRHLSAILRPNRRRTSMTTRAWTGDEDVGEIETASWSRASTLNGPSRCRYGLGSRRGPRFRLRPPPCRGCSNWRAGDNRDGPFRDEGPRHGVDRTTGRPIW